MALLVMVEDRVSLARALTRRVMEESPNHRLVCLDHEEAIEPPAERALGRADVIVVDCKDRGRQQVDPSASQLASLDVLDRLSAMGSPARVYTYSTDMAQPAVNIPIREYPIVLGSLTVPQLLVGLPDMLAGKSPEAQVPPPVDADYDRLQVGREAKVASAHQLMKRRPDAWELIWQRWPAAPTRATRAWVNRNVGPLLDANRSDCRHVVSVLRTVAGLPTESFRHS